MKISFVINEPVQDATGGYKMVYMYANYLASQKHDVNIYYLCRKEKLFTNYKWPFFIKYFIAFFLSMKGPKWFDLNKKIHGKAIKEISDKYISNGDIIVATAVNTSYGVRELSEIKGKKVYFIQGYENWENDDNYANESYKLNLYNIVIASWLKKIVDKYSKKESIIISNGIDNNVFYNKNIKRDKHSIVFQYRKNKAKGSEYAIRTIIELKKKYKDLIVRVISTDDKPTDLPTWCEFYQSITPQEVADINNKTEVFICTSIKEGYGLPGLEAMACGCVVCSSGYEGVYEYAVNNENALISPIKDVDKMVNNICSVFESEELRDKLIKNALDTVSNKSHIVMASRFEEILGGLIND